VKFAGLDISELSALPLKRVRQIIEQAIFLTSARASTNGPLRPKEAHPSRRVVHYSCHGRNTVARNAGNPRGGVVRRFTLHHAPEGRILAVPAQQSAVDRMGRRSASIRPDRTAMWPGPDEYPRTEA